MKVLRAIKNTILGHKYIITIVALLIIGSGGVFALANTSNTSGFTIPQTQTPQAKSNTSQPSNTSVTPSNNSTESSTQSATVPTTTTTAPSQSVTTTPNTDNQANNTTTPPAPTCDTAAQAQDVTEFQNAYSADQSQAYTAIYAFGYSPPFPQSIEQQVLAIENTFNTKWTNLKITFENEMSSINCTASVPSEPGLNFSP